MKIKLPVRRVVDLQRVLMAPGDVNAMVNPVARGNTFRRRLDKATDDELERFLRGVKRLAHVLDPLQPLSLSWKDLRFITRFLRASGTALA
jgi:hypothetical protein